MCALPRRVAPRRRRAPRTGDREKLAHPGPIGLRQRVPGVILRLAHGVRQIETIGEHCRDRGSQRASRAVIASREPLPAVAADHAGLAVERVDDLRGRLVRAGDQHMAAPGFDQALRAHGERWFLVFFGVGQTPGFGTVGRQDRRTRQQELAQRVEHLVARQLVAATRGEHGIEYQRYVRIIGEDLRDGSNVFDAAEHADLECVDGHVLEQAARLVGDPLGVERLHAFDAHRVLHRDGGQHRQRMTAHARERQCRPGCRRRRGVRRGEGMTIGGNRSASAGGGMTNVENAGIAGVPVS